MRDPSVDLWAIDEVHFQQHGSRCQMWIPPETKDPVLLHAPPAILLRESYRENGKVKTRTIANISHLRPQQIESLRGALSGSVASVTSPLPDSFRIQRSRPHGHVAAVIGSLRILQLEAILDSQSSRQRDLVVAMIAARILDPASKLATTRGLHSDTLHSSLGELLGLDSTADSEFYAAMDWLLERQSRIERELAKRQLENGGIVLYDLTSTYFEGRHCPLARLGHSRDGKSGNPQLVLDSSPTLRDVRLPWKFSRVTPAIPKPWPRRWINCATASAFRRSYWLATAI